MQLQWSVISSWLEELKRVIGTPNRVLVQQLFYKGWFFRGSKVCLPQ